MTFVSGSISSFFEYEIIIQFNYVKVKMLLRKQTNIRQVSQQIHNPIIHYLFEKQYQIVYNPHQFIIFFLVVGLIFLFLTVVSFLLVRSVKQIQITYARNQACVNSQLVTDQCSIIFNVTQDINQKVYIFYRVQNIYINHRKFLNSQSAEQLRGKVIQSTQAFHQCYPITFNKDISRKNSWGGSILNQSQVASPCGLKPQSFFNDTYKIYKDGKLVQIQRSGLYNGKAVDFFRGPNSQQKQWIDVQNQDFKIYMLDSALLTRTKLWGILPSGIKAGKYELLASNSYNLPDQKMIKGLILSTSSLMGGKQYFYSTVFAIITCLCFLMIVITKIQFKGYSELEKAFLNS